MLSLIPYPKKLRATGKKLSLAALENIIFPEEYSTSLLEAAVLLADEMEAAAMKRVRFSQSELPGVSLWIDYAPEIEDGEAYRLEITEKGILLEAATEVGLFYGIQTLRQLVRTEGSVLPGVRIEDVPDFAARGFYHDCTRSKVPTLETLFLLADKLAYYKMNQLQLYIEHTFAFAHHSDMWSGSDPLTAEEIIRLDHYCNARHIDLVPSLSTFGHFYIGLRSQRKKHLNELDTDAPGLPFSFHDRMAHYTLNPSDPESIKLVEDMLAEFLPLFSSQYFNICCDETFDLGKGKNAKKVKKLGSTTKLYAEFLQKIIKAVNNYGKTAMFWGDIIAEEPELIKDLPKGTVALEWDYGYEAAWRDTKKMSESGFPFYICPGVAGWSHFLPHIECAAGNIIHYAEKGLKYGASGLLNTDWGDYGHINLLGCSYHGLALGAAAAWNLKAAADIKHFDAAFSRIELGDNQLLTIPAWRENAKKSRLCWANIQRTFDPSLNYQENLSQLKNIKAHEYKAALKAISKAEADFLAAASKANPLDSMTYRELVTGIRGNILMHKIAYILAGYRDKDMEPRQVADEMRAFEYDFSILWHKRNKPSEYYRFRELFMRISEKLDSIK